MFNKNYLQEKTNIFSFIESNFSLYNDLIRKDSYNYQQMMFLLTSSMLQIFSTYLNAYRYLSGKNEKNLNALINIFTYLDVFNLITINETFYLIYFISSFTISTFYFSFYWYFIIYHKKKLRKLFFGRIFRILTKYYIWILFYPSIITNFSRIFCSEIIFSNLSQIKCNIYNLQNIIFILLSILSIFFSSFMVVLYCLFYYNSIYHKKDYFSNNNEFFLLLYNLKKFLLGLLVTILSKNMLILFLMFILVLNLFFLYYYIILNPFSRNETSKLYLFFLIAFLGNILGCILNEIASKFYYKSSNSVFYIFIFIFFLEISIFIYSKHKNEIYIINETKIYKNYSKFSKFALLFQNFLSFSNSINFNGKLQFHVENCRKLSCFCKSEKIFDFKKNKNVIAISNKSLFAKYLIKEKFEEFVFQNKNSIEINILFSDFLFKKFKNLNLAIMKINSLENKILYPTQKYKIYKIRSSISTFNKKMNQGSYNGKLEIETIIFLEEQIDKVIYYLI